LRIAAFLAVVFPKLGKDDGSDRHVDADAERIGAADEFEQTFLRELLDKDAVLRQQSGVVNADAVAQPALDVFSVRAVEAHAFKCFGDGSFLVF